MLDRCVNIIMTSKPYGSNLANFLVPVLDIDNGMREVCTTAETGFLLLLKESQECKLVIRTKYLLKRKVKIL